MYDCNPPVETGGYKDCAPTERTSRNRSEEPMQQRRPQDQQSTNATPRGVNLRGSAPYVNYADIGKLESAGAATEALRASGGTIQVPITGAFHRLDPSFATTVKR